MSDGICAKAYTCTLSSLLTMTQKHVYVTYGKSTYMFLFRENSITLLLTFSFSLCTCTVLLHSLTISVFIK